MNTKVREEGGREGGAEGSGSRVLLELIERAMVDHADIS